MKCVVVGETFILYKAMDRPFDLDHEHKDKGFPWCLQEDIYELATWLDFHFDIITASYVPEWAKTLLLLSEHVNLWHSNNVNRLICSRGKPQILEIPLQAKLWSCIDAYQSSEKKIKEKSMDLELLLVSHPWGA